MSEEVDKITRNPDTLLVKLSADEVKYRNKYLPDPSKLTNEKLLCTVCSKSLVAEVHKGGDLFVHRFLQVLVCEDCYNFYGDGCFSCDEDGDDKYCRWCGQGGTLFLCATCTCAFCKKCVKQNLKASVIAELDNDDWKCYICNPRPLYGTRTICWGAQELNKVAKEKEIERLKKQKEKLEKMNENRKKETERKSRKDLECGESSKRKRKMLSDDDSLSPEVLPSKTSRRDRKSNNGSVRQRETRRNNSSSDDLDKKKRLRTLNSKKRTSYVESSSEDDSDFKSKIRNRSKKKNSRESSSELSEKDRKKSKHRRAVKENIESSDDDSNDGKRTKKNRLSKKQEKSSSDDSSGEKSVKKNKKVPDTEDLSDDENKQILKKVERKKKKVSSETEDSDCENNEGRNIKHSLKKEKSKSSDSESGKNKSKEIKIDKKDNEPKLNKTTLSAEEVIVKKRINLAILWLSNTVKDISELGALISKRAKKFGMKRINTENLKTYEDVTNTVKKLRQLMSGVHSNYEHIEKNLDAQLKPWKVLIGKDSIDSDIPIQDGEMSIEKSKINTNVLPESVCLSVANNIQGNVPDHESDKKVPSQSNEEKDNFELTWSGNESDNNGSRDLISKANETLDRMEEMETQHSSSDNKNDSNEDGLSKQNSKDKEKIIHHSTPMKTLIDGESENNKKSIETVLEKSDSEPDKDVSQKKNNKEGSEKKSKKKASNETMGETLERKGESKVTETLLLKRTLSSSDESESFELFNQKLKNKWEGEEQTPNSSCGRKKNEEDVKEKSKSPRKVKITKRRETKIEGKNDCNERRLSVRVKDNKKDEMKEKVSKDNVVSEKFPDKNGHSEEEHSERDDKIEEDKFSPKKRKATKKNEEDVQEKSKSLRNVKNTKETETKMEGENDPNERSLRVRVKNNKKDEIKGKVSKDSVVSEEFPDINGHSEEEHSERDDKIEEEQFSSEKTKALEKNEEDNEENSKSSRIVGTKIPTETKAEEKNNSNKISLKNIKKGSKDNIVSEKLSDKNDQSEEEQSERDDKNEEEQYSPEKRKEENIKEKDITSPEDHQKKDKKEQNKNKTTENDESLSVKDDIIEDVQSLKKDISNLKEESMSEECIVNEGKGHKVKSIDEKGRLQEGAKSKFKGIFSSDDEDIAVIEVKSEESDDDTKDELKRSKGKVLKKISVRNLRRPNSFHLLESSDDEDMSETEKKKQILISSDEDTKKKDKQNKKHDIVTFSSAESSDSDTFVAKKNAKRKKRNSSGSDASEKLDDKKTKKRKLVRCADSSGESGGSGKKNVSKKSSQGESPGKGGRKNIKKIKKGDDLADATKEAAEEEKERRRRIEDRQKLYNKVFEIKESATVDNLVLDFDLENKKELVSVDKDLVAKMKPHQAKGVKFMWDSCFESLSELKKSKGSGCILAHCMGLGKTFQVVSLLHTLLMHEETKIRTVMVVCPLSTVLNWFNEFDKWLKDVEGGDSIDVYHLVRCKANVDRARELRHWQNTGGVLIIGYEMFRNLSCDTKKFRPKMRKDFQETLVDPGADIIVCDEGHMLKNEATALSKAMTRVKTLRRIVLTGTPMQNNLKEYHCMVQFVKPNLLGSRKEFLNRFVNPITNGQFVDSTDRDVKIMKRRAHVLHKMLEGLVQRFDYNVLTPFLPPKHEYVISVCLSELQVKLYKHYLENYSQQSANNKAGSRLFQDWQALGRIWTHPRVIKMSTDRANTKKMMMEEENTDEEGSLKDFIDDDDSEKSTSLSSDGNSSDQSIKSEKNVKSRVTRSKRATRSSQRCKGQHLESSEEEKMQSDVEEVIESDNKGEWWSEMIEEEHLDDINHSGKLCLLFSILKECEAIEDKVLVFSQSLFSLDLIEYFLDKIDAATQENQIEERLGNHQGNWSKGLDYFRLDGSTSSDNRNIWCNAFNREDNPRARLFLISTRAGGLGINLTGANRVIIFDASWNPSHDVQSIFRVYRFGQKKPCYVYRFIAYGTMEEKVYDRQVAKQSMSNRVVDEQQIHRHFSSNDLNELYSFTPPSKLEDRPIPVLPKDVLLAEILTQFKEWIEKYHEHDSLLENVEAEELNEEERKLAWEDFENDKKRSLLPTTGSVANELSAQIEMLRANLKAQYPDKTDTELQPLLVSQVTVLMRQKQQLQQQQWQAQQRLMAAQAQARANAGSLLNPQMYPSANLTPEQMYNLQVLQMQQQQQWANMNMSRARLQMTQTRQRVPQNVLGNQRPSLPVQSQLSQLLINPQTKNVQMPKINFNPNTALGMENMRQRYLAARPTPSTATITELPADPKPSTS